MIVLAEVQEMLNSNECFEDEEVSKWQVGAFIEYIPEDAN